MVETGHYLVLSSIVFTIGVVGVLTRRNVIIILMSIELMLNSVNLNLIAFSAHLQKEESRHRQKSRDQGDGTPDWIGRRHRED